MTRGMSGAVFFLGEWGIFETGQEQLLTSELDGAVPARFRAVLNF